MATPYSFFQTTVTVEDTAKPISTLTNRPVKLLNCDMQVQTNAMDLGDRSGQELLLNTGDTYGNPLPNVAVDLTKVWVKNHTAGSNAKLVVTGHIYDG